VKLVAASLDPPPGLAELIADLGNGENGFSGTPVHTGEATLEEFLRQCRDMPDPTKLRPGLVPQTVFWVLDDDGVAIGVVRLRHYLNDRLRVHGGHIGFYIRSDRRGKGSGKRMLALALNELRKLGEERALITTNPENTASMRIIEANGGRFSDISSDPDTGAQYRRYWIHL